MAKIYKHTNPSELDLLLKPTKEVDEPYNTTKNFLWMVTDIIETLASIEHAVGLAANQIGYGYRVFALKIEGKIEVFVNPRIIKRDSKATSFESCLSIPEYTFEVERDYEIEVEYKDIYHNPRKAQFSGLLSYCIQHELDHLDGKLVSEIAKREIPK
jgi:peptide deformylase